MIFDPIYLLAIAPGLLFSMWASYKTKSAFNKYSQVRAASGISGAEAAKRLLASAGIDDVEVVATRGRLSDHYNPVTKKLALSEPVYGSSSVAAIGVACHEAGHAIQHNRNYAPLWLRSALVPTVGIGSSLGYMVMAFGLFIHPSLVLIGAALFGMVLLFQIVTLPVEFDASARAKRLATEHGLILPQEKVGMDRVLNAAAMTYVAAVVSTLLTILYYLWRAGFLGGSRD